MKIIRIHIDNFGKLSGLDKDFSEGMNSIMEDNGWGKSTLCSFLRVMFYGFEGTSKRDSVQNERRRYTPWNNQTFGGSVEFEVDGKRYLLTRTFGKKDSEDVSDLKYADTKLPVPSIDASCCGMKFFEMDRESFSHSAFISQAQSNVYSSTDGISAKISNLYGISADMSNYDSAITRLEEAINAMTPRRATGKIARTKEQMDSVKGVLLQKATLDDVMKKYQSEEDAISDEFNGLRKSIDETKILRERMGTFHTMIEKKEKILTLREDVRANEEILKNARDVLGGVIPSDEDLRRLTAENDALEHLMGQHENATLTDEQKVRLEELEKIHTVVPDTEEIDRMLVVTGRAEKLKEEMGKDALSGAEEKKYLIGEKRYGENPDFADKLSKANKNWDEYIGLQKTVKEDTQEIENLTETINDQEAQKDARAKKAKKTRGKFILFAVILIAAAGYMFVMKHSTGGAIGLGIPALILLVLGFTFKKKEEVVCLEEKKKVKALEEDMQYANSKSDGMIKRIVDFLKETEKLSKDIDDSDRDHDYSDGKSVRADLVVMKREYEEYLTLKERYDKFRELGQYEEYDVHLNKVREFLANAGCDVPSSDSELDDALHLLRREILEMNQLRAAAGSEMSFEERVELDRNKLVSDIKSFDPKGITDSIEGYADKIDAIRSAQVKVRTSEENLTKAQKILKDMEDQTENLDEVMAIKRMGDEISVEEADERIAKYMERQQELAEKMNDLSAQMDETARQLEELGESEAELERLQESYDEDMKYFDDLEMAKKVLEDAKISLQKGYLAPLKNAFDKYYTKLTGENADDVMIDARYDISIKREGQYRDPSSLSSGYQDLIGLCMRMAYVDAMFKSEKPFLVFDDPFVNLDSDKTAQGMELLADIAKEYQIVYFTCHASRT